tara:strand:+ start:890 stop:1048 length:159 start_codon:yes stop_codon:yes gene_type:complete
MTRYNILIDGEVVYKNLTEDEYFNTIEDLAQDYYIDNSSPNPSNIKTEFIED